MKQQAIIVNPILFLSSEEIDEYLKNWERGNKVAIVHESPQVGLF